MVKAGSTQRSGLPLVLLIGCALLIRALLPSGWMPATQGGFSFILCSGWTSAQESAAMAESAYRADMIERLGRAGKDGGRTAADEPCAFSGLAMAWTGAEGAPRLSSPVVAPAPLFLTLIVAVGRGLAAPPPPSTGPPLLI
ncbi:MAG TPA: hypothetical protein VI381_03975 [Allosphingosinicella sp.]